MGNNADHWEPTGHWETPVISDWLLGTWLMQVQLSQALQTGCESSEAAHLTCITSSCGVWSAALSLMQLKQSLELSLGSFKT